MSRTSTLFDPLGFVSPFLSELQRYHKNMWTFGVTWDQELPDELAKLASVRFKVQDQGAKVSEGSGKDSGQVKNSQLHVFTELSQGAYTAGNTVVLSMGRVI